MFDISEETGWTIFGCSLVMGAVVIAISSMIYFSEVNQKISEMVENGADPIEAAIALENIPEHYIRTYFLGKR